MAEGGIARAPKGVVLLDGVRTPFARSGGAFERLHVTDLGRHVMIEALARADVRVADVGSVVFGCAGMPSDAANPARVAALRAGLPPGIPALTVQRNCASGMEAVAQAASLIELGLADVVLCGGMESMTNYAAEFPQSYRQKMARVARAKGGVARAAALAKLRPADFAAEWGIRKGLRDPSCGLDMGQTAEVLAREMGIGREEQDAFALRSHQRALASRGFLAGEIVPVPIPGKGEALVHDDAVRDDQSMPRLAKLKPAFSRDGHGTVTPGNACGITDGACAIVVASEKAAAAWSARTKREPLGRIAGWSAAGVAPERMGLGPAAALPRALDAAKWTLDQLGVVEINEAFAVQVLACLRVMQSAELMKKHASWPVALGTIDETWLNPHGGAIALGHPVGVSGARIVLTLARELRRRSESRGAATLCVGGGQGMAVLVER